MPEPDVVTSKPRKPRGHRPHLKPEEREARNALMLSDKLHGIKLVDIAASFHIAVDTVEKGISKAKMSGALELAKGYVAQTLMPKALNVFNLALDQGDVDVATKVLEGCGVIGRQGGLRVEVEDGGGEGFTDYRLRIIRAQQQADQQTPAATEAQELKQLSEGEGGNRCNADL